MWIVTGSRCNDTALMMCKVKATIGPTALQSLKDNAFWLPRQYKRAHNYMLLISVWVHVDHPIIDVHSFGPETQTLSRLWVHELLQEAGGWSSSPRLIHSDIIRLAHRMVWDQIVRLRSSISQVRRSMHSRAVLKSNLHAMLT